MRRGGWGRGKKKGEFSPPVPALRASIKRKEEPGNRLGMCGKQSQSNLVTLDVRDFHSVLSFIGQASLNVYTCDMVVLTVCVKFLTIIRLCEECYRTKHHRQSSGILIDVDIQIEATCRKFTACCAMGFCGFREGGVEV